MCWSPTADLVAGSVITAVGVFAMASVRRARDAPMAALPLILGVHQLIEIVVWRNAGVGIGGGMNSGGMNTVGGTAVLLWTIIAFPLLAAYVPLALFCVAGRWGRLRLVPYVVVGLVTCAMLAYAVASGPVTAQPVGHTMRYNLHHLSAENAVVTGYLMATVGGLLMSDQRVLRWLGVVTGLGAIGCFLLWQDEFASTWCALAAVASVMVLYWLRRPRYRRDASGWLRRTRVPVR